MNLSREQATPSQAYSDWEHVTSWIAVAKLSAGSDLPSRVSLSPSICEPTEKDTRQSGPAIYLRPDDRPVPTHGYRQSTSDPETPCPETKAPATLRRPGSPMATTEFSHGSITTRVSRMLRQRPASQTVQNSWARIPSKMDRPKTLRIFSLGSNPTCSVQAARMREMKLRADKVGRRGQETQARNVKME